MATLLGATPTDRTTPRDFAIDPSGAWLFAANQGSGNVITFAIDPTTGGLTRTGTPLAATMPSYIGFVGLP
jgi:6-phosphogluconolactonase (cycloisomerase 2 family)